VTVSRFNSRCGTFISVCNQLPKSTQPGHPFVSMRNEYQPKGGYALRLGSKGVCVWQVELCEPYLSALEIMGVYIKRYIN